MHSLEHQDAVARTERVAERRFPGPGTRRREDDDRISGLKNFGKVLKNFPAQRTEFRTAMIDGGVADGSQQWIRHRTGSGNLQKMPARWMKIGLEHEVS